MSKLTCLRRTFLLFSGFLFLVFLTSGQAKADLIWPRYVVMSGVSTLNLFFPSLVGWKSVQEDPRPKPKEGGFSPNYNLSPDSPEAMLIQKIADADPHASWVRGIRTIPRSYYEKFLREAQEGLLTLPKNSFAQEALRHLQNEQATQNKRWGAPYVETRLDATYNFSSSPNRSVPGVAGGTVNPFFGLREGDFSEDGHNGSIGTNLRGGFSPWFSYEVAPYALFSSNDAGTKKHTDFYLHRGYVKVNIRNFEVELGRDTVQWGYGRQGTMLFSGNAEPFYLFRVSNSLPVELPWFFHWLGPTRVDFFLAPLEKGREFPYTILQGSKVTFLPHPRWEVGFGQSIQFGGEGSGSWNPLNYFSEGITGDENVNRNFILDTRWRIPKLEIEPYLELFGEDCCDPAFINPRDILNLAGIYFPNIGLEGRADFAAEWVRTNEITYRHGDYISGFFYKGDVMGHPIGPDGNGVYGIFRYFFSPTLLGKVVSGFEQRERRAAPSPEDRYRIELDLQHQFFHRMRFLLEAGYERVMRLDFVPGNNRNNFMGGFRLEFSS